MFMTIIRKSTIVGLIGALVTIAAVTLPLVPAFGEGGARRDVLLREAASKATSMEMLFLVEFEAAQAGTPTSRAQQIEQLEALPPGRFPEPSSWERSRWRR
jgi:hypothetical protein